MEERMTQTCISLLRGINVSGKNMIKMAELQQLYAGLGYTSIQTYLQSGNVIFQTNIEDQKNIANKIKTKIEETFGFDVPILVLQTSDLEYIIKCNTFTSEVQKDISLLHVTFLHEKPKKELLEKIENIDFKPDEFIILNKAIYLYCPNGYGRTKLTNTFFENKLKVTATTRNWKTTNELLVLATKLNT